eukprot:CAMPEP_0169162672 /NCGR_PEP_ID=MMETSP1015-20121227/57780_1 /TAXON_ID=342587 /ORGANISM="Karlodinium micrum, Strain CCMP2283" /LENGTH=99 /DNA_ID=CAMNT_0009234765 /DNA_START=228 /DNA_END=527 /DNA_ORIENTATION=+
MSETSLEWMPTAENCNGGTGATRLPVGGGWRGVGAADAADEGEGDGARRGPQVCPKRAVGAPTTGGTCAGAEECNEAMSMLDPDRTRAGERKGGLYLPV